MQFSENERQQNDCICTHVTQVTEESFDSCDLSAEPLFIWSDASVDRAVSVQGLQPGQYFFICAVSGHCSAGKCNTYYTLEQLLFVGYLHPNSCFCCFSIPTSKIKYLL